MQNQESTGNDLPSQARVIIIGGGIVGCSVAYHLAQKQVKDIVLLEQDRWPEPGGSTSHASNFIFPIDHSEVMAKLTKYSAEFYDRLGTEDRPLYIRSGGIEVARTKDRMQELKRKISSGKTWGIEAELITPRETKELFPFINYRRIRGAMFTPGAGLVTRSVDAARIMVESAVSIRALKVFQRTKVTGIEVVSGRIRGVHTNKGYISAEIVVSAAGVWGPLIGEMTGASIPLVPTHHQLVYTTPVPELEGAKRHIEWPVLRDQDRAMYLRQEFNVWEIGSYQHPSLFTEPNDIREPDVDPKHTPSMIPFTPEHFRKPMADISEMVPVLEDAGFHFGFNGLISVTSDGLPILGETPQVKGFWSAEAVWVKEAPGVGNMVAEWIVDKETTIPSHQVDISRFHEHALTDTHIRSRAAEYFQKIYGIVHPQEQWTSSRNIRLSPFVQRQRELDAVFHETGGWERPYWYGVNEQLMDEFGVTPRIGWEAMWWSPIIGAEHQAVRHRVGMIDLTGFVKFDITGHGAACYVDRMAVKNMDRQVGSVVYTPILNEAGGIKCDLTITKLAEDRFRVITSAAIGTHDITWFRRHCPTDGSVYIEDVTSSLCCVGVWGPRARQLIQSVCESDVSNDAFPFASAQQVILGGLPVMAVRVSYVGELGWEIYASTEYGEKLWDILWDAGQDHGVVAAGISVYLSSLRLEKGYRSWGHELHTGYNLFEAGILKDASFDIPSPIKRADFNGKDAVLRFREQRASRRLVCMTFDETEDVVLGHEPILDGDDVLGYVTSSDYGYSVGTGIAYGYVPSSYTDLGTAVEVGYLGRRLPAKITMEPLFDPEGYRFRS